LPGTQAHIPAQFGFFQTKKSVRDVPHSVIIFGKKLDQANSPVTAADILPTSQVE
jgi:hypothetical protein